MQTMSKWKLHGPTADNIFLEYKCGLRAGQRVRLRKDLPITRSDGTLVEVTPCGQIWEVLPGVHSDPVLWFREPSGERHTWDDDPALVAEWFEIVSDSPA
jgi:hypothetical protein